MIPRGKGHGWFIDPFAIRVGKGTADNPGHPRQCGAKNKYGEQCGRWSLQGRLYCQFHGGRQPLTRFKVAQRYGKYVSKSLADVIKSMTGTPQEVLDLTEEVSISRVMLGNALTLATPCFDPDHKEHKKIDDNTRAIAIGTLRHSLDFVAKMVSTLAKIESLSSDKVPASHLEYFMTKVMEVIDDNCTEKLARKIGEHIGNIKLPDANEIKTHVTLDLD